MSDSEYSSDEDDSGESQNNEQTYWVSDFSHGLVKQNSNTAGEARKKQAIEGVKQALHKKVAVAPHRLLGSQADQNNGSLRH